MTIALSHGGTTIYQSPRPSERVLVGTKEGIAILEREPGGPWRVSHQVLQEKFIHAIIMEPESGLVFAGASHGGIHASADGGFTWERRDGGLAHNDVYSLAYRKVRGRPRLFAGTEPAHLFYSDDLGRSWGEFPSVRKVPSVPNWRFPGPPHIAHLKHINFDSLDSKVIYASIEVGELLKSADEGQTWQELGVPYKDVHRAIIPPNDPRRIYVTGGNGLYVTSDGGGTWEHWTTRESAIGGYPDQLVYHPRNPDLMFVCAGHQSPSRWGETRSAGSRISRSRDGGRTWEVLGGGLPDRMQASIEAFCLEDWGEGFSLFAATTAGEIWCSEDGGNAWEVIVRGLAPISKGGHYKPLVAAAAA